MTYVGLVLIDDDLSTVVLPMAQFVALASFVAFEDVAITGI